MEQNKLFLFETKYFLIFTCQDCSHFSNKNIQKNVALYGEKSQYPQRCHLHRKADDICFYVCNVKRCRNMAFYGKLLGQRKHCPIHKVSDEIYYTNTRCADCGKDVPCHTEMSPYEKIKQKCEFCE